VAAFLSAITFAVYKGESSIFWKVIVSAILSKKVYIYIYKCPFQTVSEIELFHWTFPELLIKMKYCILFIVLVFIVQMGRFIDFA
jgi:hypothetical protein